MSSRVFSILILGILTHFSPSKVISQPSTMASSLDLSAIFHQKFLRASNILMDLSQFSEMLHVCPHFHAWLVTALAVRERGSENPVITQTQNSEILVSFIWGGLLFLIWKEENIIKQSGSPASGCIHLAMCLWLTKRFSCKSGPNNWPCIKKRMLWSKWNWGIQCRNSC